MLSRGATRNVNRACSIGVGLERAVENAVAEVGSDSAHVFTTANGIPAGQFSEFAEEGDGTVWLAFGGRIGHFDGSRFHELELPEGVGMGVPARPQAARRFPALTTKPIQ